MPGSRPSTTSTFPPARSALVYALDGFEGNYGTKEEAAGYLPDFNRGADAP